MTYQSEVAADSPLLHWRLGETSGTTAVDSSGNGRNGTHTNVTVNATGLLVSDTDKAADYNGSSSITKLATASWMNVAEFTVEAVTQADTLTTGTATAQTIVDRRQNGSLGVTAQSWQFRFQDRKLKLLCFTGSTVAEVVAATTILPGETHHVAGRVRYNGTAYVAEVLLDGTVDGSLTLSAGVNQTASNFWVGATDNSRPNPSEYFDGRIDEVAYYGSALSDARLYAHAQASKGIFPAASSLSLAGTLPAIQSSLTLSSYTDTATDNRANGRIRNGGFVDESEEPVEPMPANLVRAQRVVKAIAYPTPTLDDGRPT